MKLQNYALINDIRKCLLDGDRDKLSCEKSLEIAREMSKEVADLIQYFFEKEGLYYKESLKKALEIVKARYLTDQSIGNEQRKINNGIIPPEFDLDNGGY